MNPQNPHTRDHRMFARDGEKTGSAYQAFKRRSEKPSAWLLFSTAVCIGVVIFLLFALPWEGGW